MTATSLLPVQVEQAQLAEKLQAAQQDNEALQAARQAAEEHLAAHKQQLAAFKTMSTHKTPSPAHNYPPSAAVAGGKASTAPNQVGRGSVSVVPGGLGSLNSMQYSQQLPTLPTASQLPATLQQPFAARYMHRHLKGVRLSIPATCRTVMHRLMAPIMQTRSCSCSWMMTRSKSR